MLIKAMSTTAVAAGLPKPSPSPMSFKIGLQFSTPLPFPNANVRNWWSGRSNNGVKCRRKRGEAFLVVRAGYSRRPMETAGAYQLVDDETGEKVIVWGGVDQEDRSIPSDEVLSWKPSNKDKFGEDHNSDDQQKSVCDGEHSSGLSGSFRRLNAHRVRQLIQKTHSSKQHVSDNANEEKIVKDMVSSHVDPEVLEKQWKSDDFRNKTVLRVSKSIDTRAPLQHILTREGMKHHDIAVKQQVEDLPKFQSTSKKFQKLSEPDSVSRSSSSSLRGWGIVRSTPNFKSKPEDILQKLWKTNTDKDFFSKKSFRDLGCSNHLIDALKNQHFVRPSHIQAMAFTPVIAGKSGIIADQSGSGKTLAYLLPVIQRLREEEVQGLGKSLPQNPRVVILVPTAELASQVLRNCRSISKFGVQFRSMVATGGFRQKTQLESLHQGLDVLIATPGRFTFLIKEGFMQLTNLRCAVLDEVDILFKDEDFDPALQSLITCAPVTTQYLFVTATLPVDIYNKLVESFPDCELITGPGMHRISSGLEEVLVDCSGEDGTEKTTDSAFFNKKSALLQLIEETPVSKTIIFCNKIETCRKVENVLKRLDRKGTRKKVLPFHAALAQELRLANMEEFCRAQLEDSSLFLVCTDRASRGIDFAGVDHVVLFDFPRDPSEYVRRVGRTARGAGGKGKAFVFVVGRQVSLARRIMERNRKGHPLHDVPSIY